ncbi:hypothetical protein ACQ4PT_038890 [Festuca glaucescens]
MASSERGKEKGQGALSPRAARARLEEQLGNMDITEEEATPLVVDDHDEGDQLKWMLAGKVLYRNVFHIQTIASALRSAWGNPTGLVFRSVGANMFVAEFTTQWDRDRVWDGSPWHVSKNAVILSEFKDCMKPSELRFDKLTMWARVMNLPFNLQEKKWWLPIAHQIDKKAKEVQFDHVGGFLRVRVTIDVANPLRRWVLIDSARRKSMDLYEIQYEQVPHFCFSCGRLGHPDILCLSPRTRDGNGDLPFGKGLRVSDDWKKPAYRSSGGQGSGHFSKPEMKKSSNAAEKGPEVMLPLKKNNQIKRKSTTTHQVYRRVETLLLENSEDGTKTMVLYKDPFEENIGGVVENVEDDGRNAKNKKPTPTSSDNPAAAAGQPCLSQ